MFPDSDAYVSQGRPVHHGLVRSDRDQGHLADRRTRATSGHDRVSRHAIPLKGQLKYDMFIWGWVGDPDPNVAAPDPDHRRDRRFERQPVVRTRPTTRCTTQQNEAATSDERKGVIDRDAEHLLRPGAVPHPVLRRRAARLPDRQVRRTGRTSRRTAARRSSSYGSINYTTLQLASAASPSPVGRGQLGRECRCQRGRVRGGHPGTVGHRQLDGQQRQLDAARSSAILLVVIGIGAAVVLSRRRRTAAEDE